MMNLLSMTSLAFFCLGFLLVCSPRGLAVTEIDLADMGGLNINLIYLV